jgi:hypothetical protein
MVFSQRQLNQPFLYFFLNRPAWPHWFPQRVARTGLSGLLHPHGIEQENKPSLLRETLPHFDLSKNLWDMVSVSS